MLGAFGKQRRTLENNNVIGSYCDPLLGFKVGAQYQVSPHFMVAPAVGIALNMDERSRSSLFADLELNRTFNGGGFIGTGIGVWDFNHSKNMTPNLLLNAATPLTRWSDDHARLLVALEGRLFFDQMSHIDNNYQFWVGLRYVFR